MKPTTLWLIAISCFLCSCGGSNEATTDASDTPAPTTAETSLPSREEATPDAREAGPQSAQPASAAPKGPFKEKLTEGPVSFIVKSPNSSPNSFTVTTTGMSVRNEATTVDVQGQVVRAKLADLNQDSYPEVYIFTRTETGTEAVYAFASYRNRSYGQIYIAEAEPGASRRGNGGTYELTETRLIRKFQPPQNGQRTGDTQSVTYALRKGETSYRLEPVE